mmetsp:Transcript_6629/g.10480  ORF Transcript_6629/g.10480 Transcript_6629/m.10480 type:complete len:93 (-) Transcript_6629:76-354(-)
MGLQKCWCNRSCKCSDFRLIAEVAAPSRSASLLPVLQLLRLSDLRGRGAASCEEATLGIWNESETQLAKLSAEGRSPSKEQNEQAAQLLGQG